MALHKLIPCLLLLALSAGPASAEIWYRDADEDGWGDESDFVDQPTQPAGYVLQAGDCDDSNPDINPAASELCNGIDDDCDGQVDEDGAPGGPTWYPDADTDGYGDAFDPGVQACTAPAGYVDNNLDCNDANAGTNPGANELCNSLDDDCDAEVDEDPADGSSWHPDADGDGYGDASTAPLVACNAPAGYVANSQDCDDGNPSVFPGATELCDSIDNDCDGEVDNGAAGSQDWWVDDDGDGYGAAGSSPVLSCTQPAGRVDNELDCDDADPGVNPGATELCNGLDDDCDSIVDEGCAPFGLTSVEDVGNDQGRRVRVRFARHPSDTAGSPGTIESYSLYRRIAAGLRQAGAAPAGAPPGDWDFVLQMPATGEDGYNSLATTLCDSTSSGICWSVFFVRAHGSTPLEYYDSAPDSGYSVDNLAPGAPQALQAAYSASGNELSWEPNPEEDLSFYRVYRSSDPNFLPGAGQVVAEVGQPSWQDPDDPGHGVHYRVSAVDFAGNEGPAASPATVTGTPGGGLPAVPRLELAYPNPFNPRTTLRLRVPAGGANLRLQLFDVVGRRIGVLHDGPMAEGEQELVWTGTDGDGRALPSGVYLARLEGAGADQVLRLVLAR